MSDLSQRFSKTLNVGSEEDFDQICDLCITDKGRVEAFVYCVDCRDFLCNECRNYHNKSSASKYHVLQDSSTIPTPQTGRTQLPGASTTVDPLTDRCQQHPEEIIKFFCNTDQQLGCSVCITLHHGACKDNVYYIREISSSIASSTELNNVHDDTKKLIAVLDTSKRRSERCHRETNKWYNEAVADVTNFRQDINRLFDQLETEVLTELSRRRKEHLNSLSRQIPIFDDLIKEGNEIRSILDRKGELKHYNQLFIAVKYAREKVSVLEKEVARTSKIIKPARFVFSRDDTLDSITSSLTRFGTLSLFSQPEDIKAKYTHDINVKFPTDTEECFIPGSTVVSGGRLALTDFHNKCVKLIDTAGRKILEKVSLTSPPKDITMIRDDEIAVTLKGEKRIQFLSLSPKLSLSHTIPAPGLYNGLTYMEEKLFLACHDPVRSVHICDMSGNLLQQFDTDHTGNKLFENSPSRITLSPDGDTIYVSDWKTSKVLSLNRDGVVTSTYTHEKLRFPQGMAVDDSGCVYVCSYDNHCVHQLFPSGQLVKILLDQKDGIMYPRSITHDTGKIYISSDSSKDAYYNNIKVYRLE